MTNPRSSASLRAPPRISVICIFYNEERYLEEAVDSVLAQDFRDFELLLVDDGSSDSSSALALRYAAQDPQRIRCLTHARHENRGMSASRNLGLSQALGEFVAFIDADDRWRPTKLREQLEILDSRPDADAVGGSVNYWASHEGGRDRVVATGHVRHRTIPPLEATLALYPLGKADAPSMSDLMFRRASIANVGGFEESFRGAYEDQAFLAKLYLESSLFLTDRVWSDYRIHSDSCMAAAHRQGTYNEARRYFLDWFDGYFRTSSHRDNELIGRALAKALRSASDGPRSHRVRAAVRARMPATAVALARAAKSALHRARTLLASGPAILMYHRIADESFDPWGLAVSPANFADQMHWISHNRTVLPLHQFAALHERGTLPPDAIAVTFDDGYACNAELAAPVLQQTGIPATIFLSASLIERGEEFWWDDLQRIALEYSGRALTLDRREIELGEKRTEDADWAPGLPPRTPRQLAYRQLWSILYRLTPRKLDEAIAELREQADTPSRPRNSHRPMRRDELRAIGSELIEFGSHSLGHASLPLLSPRDKAREIGESVRRIADLTGAEPRTFAYPYGDYDQETARIVADAGFDCACRADGWYVRRNTDRFALPRIFVGNWGSAPLARQLGRP